MTITIKCKYKKDRVTVAQNWEKKTHPSPLLIKYLLKAYMHNITKIVILKNTIINIGNQHFVIFVLQLFSILYYLIF